MEDSFKPSLPSTVGPLSNFNYVFVLQCCPKLLRLSQDHGIRIEWQDTISKIKYIENN